MTIRGVRYDDQFLEEIKSRLRLSDVIGKTVKLRRQGREYAGLSPFSKEKTPSFFVNDDKGFYHCFSSGKHGDLISFLQETERLSFPEAVERLAMEAGVPLPAPDPRAAEEAVKRQGLADWIELAAKWFEAELRRPAGKDARAYLEKRGLGEAEWTRFRLGYAPAERTRLKDYLIAKGATPTELVETGMLIAPEDGGAPYDRFRDRIMFPIGDGRGRIISFGGRALNPEARAKYLNGSDTSLFSKGHTLYGLHEARRLLHAGGEGAPLVVVEGYMDVIACQRADIAAVASQGTALTEDQMAMLWKLHPEPTLCFDADSAGRRAVDRAIEKALPLLQPGRSFRFASLTGGKDADDVLRDKGPAALRGQINKTVPLVEALFVREQGDGVFDTPEKKVAFKARLRAAAGLIQNKDLSHEYRQHLLEGYDKLYKSRVDSSEAGRILSRRRWDRVQRLSSATPEARLAARRLNETPEPLAAAVAKGALDDPKRIEDKIEILDAQGFFDDRFGQLAQDLIRLTLEVEGADAEFVSKQLRERGHGARLESIERSARTSGAAFLDPEMPLEQARALWSQAVDLLMRLAALNRALEAAKGEIATDDDVAAFFKLKGDRDVLRHTVRSGRALGVALTSSALH